MRVALGFGSTEQAFEDAEAAAFKKYATERFHALSCDYVDDALVKDVKRWVGDRAAAYRDKATEYRTAESYPDRYSSYHATVLDDASNIVVIFRFSHYNRRHPLSPDGWAMMVTEKLANFYALDIRREAAS